MTLTTQKIEIVLPVAAGQITDVVVRAMSAALEQALDCAIVVRNDGRDGGAAACCAVAKAAHDGSVLLAATTGTHVASPALQAGLPYDPRKDFVPLGMIGLSPWLLVVRADSAVQTLPEFLTWLSRATGPRGGYYSVSARGCLAELALRASVAIEMLKYPTGHEAVDALAREDVAFTFLDMVTARAMVTAGRCRVLAVSGHAAAPQWPGVPPLSSLLPGYQLTSWAMLAGPEGMTASLANTLNAGIVAALSDPRVGAAVTDIGFAPQLWDLRQLQHFLNEETLAWQCRGRAMLQQA